jgi:hypothetical protein
MISRDLSISNVGNSVESLKKSIDALSNTNQTIDSISSDIYFPSYLDKNKLILLTASSGSVNVILSSGSFFEVGTRIDFAWIGSATSVSFADGGVTINATPGLKFRARYSVASLVCIDSGTFLLVGDLSA